MEKSFWMTMDDQVEVYVKKWYDSSKEPKAIIQLAHGMVEHINRYAEFAEFLVDHGIFVYGNDHRGHGRTGENQGLLGYLADEDGFEKTTNDLMNITKQIKRDYPDTPLFLLGHSMGSFLARNYIQRNSSLINGIILSGTGFYPALVSTSAMQIASTLPPKLESNVMNSLAFRSHNKRIANKKTDSDWLSSDEKVIQSYMEDPYCGFVPTARFFYDLMEGITMIHDKKKIKSIRSDLPMFIISGAEDPVGNYSKGVWKTAHLYGDAGLKNVITMLFENGRHEILNEVNREEVYGAILNWILSMISNNT